MPRLPLSPAAEAILSAYGNHIGGVEAIMGSERRGLSAALRELAGRINGADAVRQDVLAIAAELEGGR